MQLGKRLKQARKTKGYTQAELAAASGVKQQMISKLETEKSSTTGDLLHLAKALSISPAWLGGVAEESVDYLSPQAQNPEIASLDTKITESIFSFIKIEYRNTFQQLSAQEQSRIFNLCYQTLLQNTDRSRDKRRLLREALQKSV